MHTYVFFDRTAKPEKLMSALYLNSADRIWILRFVSDIFPKKKKPLTSQKSEVSELFILARRKGFEPPFFRIGICCVIQLRHRRKYFFCV